MWRDLGQLHVSLHNFGTAAMQQARARVLSYFSASPFNI
jgi:hypothetical protein